MRILRTFALCVLDQSDEITEYFPLGAYETVSPDGLGFQLDIAVVESELADYVTRIVQKKQPIKMTLNFYRPNQYQKERTFRLFVEKHVNHRLCLEYADTVDKRYIECKVETMQVKEIEKSDILGCPIQIKPLTPFFRRIQNKVLITRELSGKRYPYRYPYRYGYSTVENNLIENTYFKDVPIIINLYGAVSNPVLSLADAAGNIYAQMMIEVELRASENGADIQRDRLLIDAINYDVRLFKFDNPDPTGINAFNLVKKGISPNTGKPYNTFLWLAAEKTSKILSPFGQSSDTGKLEASYRQYSL